MARRGRPRAAPSETVSIRLKGPDHDALAQASLERREPMTDIIRRAIRNELLYLKKSKAEPSTST